MSSRASSAFSEGQLVEVQVRFESKLESCHLKIQFDELEPGAFDTY